MIPLTIDREYLINTLTEMVQINSTNPSLSPDGVGEAEIAAYVADSMVKIGLDAQTYEIKPGRFNVVGTLKGKGKKGRSLLLNAHMDTVGVEGMSEPFAGAVRNGKMFGRGTYDMKGSLASMMAAAKALIDSGVELGGDLLVTAVADEEYASIGSEALVKMVQADGAIVTEPTELAICRAHRGFIWYKVETIGRAAHGSRFKEGIDANIRMGRFLAKLEGLEKVLRNRTPHPLTGPPSIHAPLIRGGTEVSVYAAQCELHIERRTIPGEDEPQATREIQELLDELSNDDPTFSATLDVYFQRPPFETTPTASILKTLERKAKLHLGTELSQIGQTFWTDAALFAAAGMETILIGPSGKGLHSAEEWVDIESLIILAKILADTAIAYCKDV